MVNNPLISVIIPIYKVEEYLDECVSSIVAQSYHNLEIILVDDGSPDNCPLMCDEWAKRDSRIVVVHKSNGGLSSARNAGIDVANGEYVSFIDSDDFLKEDTYELLISSLQRNKHCDIASCMLYKYVNGSVSVYNERWIPKGERFVESAKFAELCLSCEINFTVTSKIFKKSLIGGVRFREGRTNEDTLFMFDLSKKIETQNINMVEIPDCLYYYRMRDDSICNDTNNLLEVQVLRNYQEILEYYKLCNHGSFEKIKGFRDYCLINFMYRLNKDKQLKEKYSYDFVQSLKDVSISDVLRLRDFKVFVKYLLVRYIYS